MRSTLQPAAQRISPRSPERQGLATHSGKNLPNCKLTLLFHLV